MPFDTQKEQKKQASGRQYHDSETIVSMCGVGYWVNAQKYFSTVGVDVDCGMRAIDGISREVTDNFLLIERHFQWIKSDWKCKQHSNGVCTVRTKCLCVGEKERNEQTATDKRLKSDQIIGDNSLWTRTYGMD